MYNCVCLLPNADLSAERLDNIGVLLTDFVDIELCASWNALVAHVWQIEIPVIYGIQPL